MLPPEIKKEPHWEELHLPIGIGSGRGFRPDSKGRQALRMAFFKASSEKNEMCRVEGKVWFGQGVEGPPGHVHGGVSAYILDEAMGSVAWANYLPCVAQNIELQYENMTPIAVDHDVLAEVDRIEGRKVFVFAKIYDKKTGKIFSYSKGFFHILPRDFIKKVEVGDDSDFAYDKLKFVDT